MKRFGCYALAAATVFALLWFSFQKHSGNTSGAGNPPAPSRQSGGATGGTAATAPKSTETGAPPAKTEALRAAIGRVGAGQAGVVPPAASGGKDAPRKRPWDPEFLKTLRNAAQGEAVRFELVGGQWAEGTVRLAQHKDGELIHIAGLLTAPEAGRFFFQKQTRAGVAGDFVGVVEFPKSKQAYRIEPTGPNGAPELVERPLEGVICYNLPAATNLTEEIPPLKPGDFPTNPIPAYQNGIIALESLPGSLPVLYIDYQGGYTPTWGGITYARPNENNATIRDVWKRVAEDYMPFNINVTTDLKVWQNAPQGSRQRVVVTPTTTAAPGAGGVAYIGSFNWTGEPDTPCWGFYSSGKAAAEVISHEAGHTLNLGHDGRTTPSEGYYGGQGSGEVGWAPIMGVGYYQPVAQWSKGEYANANNTEDDLAKIVANNNVHYRADDTGSTLATSRYLETYSNSPAFAEGVIEQTADTDAFQFTTTGGAVSLRADPVGDWANLAIALTLCDATETVLASNNPQTTLWAAISTNLPAGTYTIKITGAGRNDPLTDGFSTYDSLGYYTVTGAVAGARLPNRFTIAENSTNGTLVGVLPAINTNGNPLVYAILSGNTSNTFAIDNTGHLTVLSSAALNYEFLARSNQLAVQFEMFLNITNTVDPLQTETNRRVLVAVTNVNEPPTLAGFTNTVLEHSQAGLLVGTLTASDPDYYTVFAYSLLSGNSNTMFALDTNYGTITVAGDLNAATQSVYTLTVAVSDQTAPTPLMATSTVVIRILTNTSPFRPGSISYALYDGLSGSSMANLTNASVFPRDPTSEKQMSLFEGDNNRADNYGAVLRGYLIPPSNGYYTFWIATDDDGELWLSTSTNTASATRIAYVSGYTGVREWTKFSSQSNSISLLAGQAYYIEGRMKEGAGGDNIAVAWQCLSNGITQSVIAGKYLAPYFMNYLPHAVGFTNNLRRDAVAGSRVGTVGFTDVNTNDGHSFSIISGNTSNTFSIEPLTGLVRVADDAALLVSTQASFTLQVRVVDTGSPPLSNTDSVVINLLVPSSIAATSIRQEMWNGIGGGVNVSDLTGNTRYPKRPDALRTLTTFDSGADFADNYGSRIRAYLTPTNSGAFTFFIASDDASQLKFGSTTNPAAATNIASVASYTSYQVWTAYASQKSVPISLVAGQAYYIEALQKEGGGGDHVSVAWTGPGIATTNVIDGAFLTPLDLNFPPDFTNLSAQVAITATNGTLVTNAVAGDSSLDTIAYKIVSGNTGNTFAINPDTGAITVSDNTLIRNWFASTFSLGVVAQDSGYGGLYPLESTQIVVTVQITDNTSPFVWSGGGTNDLWSTASNWNNTIPSNGVKLVFSGTIRQTNTNDLVTSVGPLVLSNGGFNLAGNPVLLLAGLSSSGTNTWSINSTLNRAQSFTNATGQLTLAGNVTNGGNLLTLVVSNALRIDGVVSGAGGLTKIGPGTLTMTASNLYTGDTTISLGTLELGNGTNNGSLAGNVPNSGTLKFIVATNTSVTQPGVVSGVGTLYKDGFGTLVLAASNTFSGGVTINAGPVWIRSSGGLGAGTKTVTMVNGTAGHPELHLDGSLGPINLPPAISFQTSWTGGTVFNEAGDNSIAGNFTLTGGGGDTSILVNGGTLTLSGSLSPNTTGRNLQLGGAGAGFVTGVISNGTGANTLSSVAKNGPGSWTLASANTYSGPTVVNAGTLLVSNSTGSATSTNNVTVFSSATLGGNGIILGAVTNKGILAPSPAISTLTISNSLTLQGGSTTRMEVSKDTGATNDVIAGLSTISYGGSLMVTNIGSNALAAGDTFQLFSATNYTGSFTNLTLPPLGAGLAWDTSKSSTNGSIAVASLPSITSQPQSLTVNQTAPASFSVGATGTTPLAYQWRKNGGNLSGATNTSFNIANATTNDAGSYTVVVTNLVGSVTSAVATLTVRALPPGYYLVWADEFNSASLDTNKWDYWALGARRDASNVANAVSLNGSNLVVTTYTSNGVHYSGGVWSPGRFHLKYGYVESSIQYSNTPGDWSAFWMQSPTMGQYLGDPAFAGEEIDISEHRQVDSGSNDISGIVNMALHWDGYGASHKSVSTLTPNLGLGAGFHTYAYLWTETNQATYVDETLRWAPATQVSQRSEYLLLSSEVQSNSWAGTPPPGGFGSLASSTTKMSVDYVRCYAPTTTVFWTGLGSAAWTNSANWISNRVPQASHDVVISYLSASNFSASLGQDFSLRSLSILETTGALTISSNTLTLGAGGLDMVSAANNVTLNSAVTLGATQAWSIATNRTLTVNGNITGSGQLTLDRFGTVTLAGNNSYTGGTRVFNGTLLAANIAGSATGTNTVTVASNATLGGTGFILGAVTVQSNATLAPGSGLGTLTISNALTLQAGSTTRMEINKGVAGTNDQVRGVGTLTFGGALLVTNVGGVAITAGDTFKLFAATSYAGSFSSTNLPALTVGLAWNTTQLGVSGTISVASAPAVVSVTPTNQTVECSSNASLTVSAVGVEPLAYRWFLGPTLLSGATNASLTLTNVHPAQAGTYSVIVTNLYGSATSGPVTLSVMDTQPPTILACAAPQTLNADASCHATLPSLVASIIAVDACSSTTVTQSPPAGTVLGLGLTTVTFTAFDGSGNSAQCAAAITVRDVTPPTILFCATNTTLAAGANCQALLPNLTGTNFIRVVDNCSSVTVTQSVAINTPLALGTNLVILGAFDASGNVAYGTNRVVVLDQTPPDLTCSTNLLLGTDPGQCSKSNVTFGFTATDTCPVTNSACVPPSGSTFATGPSLVTCTARDSSGNSAQCTFTVTVTDTENPQITCPADLLLTKDSGQSSKSNVTFLASATDNCAVTNVACVPPSGSTFPLGTNLVTCTARDASGHSATCGFGVVVLSEFVVLTNETVSVRIPDGTPVGLVASLDIATPMEVITDVNVTLQVSGGFNGDLFAYLVHDSGHAILLNRPGKALANPSGYSDSGLNVTFDDSAPNGDIHSYRVALFSDPNAPLPGALTNAWAPDGRDTDPALVLDTDPRPATLSAFNGLNPNGRWTLFIADVDAAYASTLVSWGLQIHGTNAPPLITTPPQSRTNVLTTEAVFSVAATVLSAPSYQWFCNGTALTNATNATLHIPNVQTNHAGLYTVRVTTLGGSVLSQPATLTVIDQTVNGLVEMEFYVGLARNGAGSRTVTFKGTDATNSPLATWNLPLNFTNRLAGFTLPHAPLGLAHLSAKTAWHLRTRLPVSFTNGLATLNFTSASALRAGDLDDSNAVNLGDYFILAGAWATPNTAADLDGSGWVDLDDYFLLANRWNLMGDPE